MPATADASPHPLDAKIAVALARIESVVQEYQPTHVFGMFSGGHDSLTATAIASRHPMFSGAVHCNTGIGIEATREFVRRTCADEDWRLLEYKALENLNSKGELDPQDYEKIVREFGFPGPAGHNMMYARLKQRALQRLERDFKATARRSKKAGKDRRLLLYVSGCRSEESTRRMGTTKLSSLDGRRVWCNPIMDWTKVECHAFMRHAKLARNPVVDLIHKSGECLCGAFAAPGELEELKLWELTRPAYERIIALQAAVKACGFPWGWEERPPEWFLEEKRGQGQMFDADLKPKENPLCWSCTKGHERAGSSADDRPNLRSHPGPLPLTAG